MVFGTKHGLMQKAEDAVIIYYECNITVGCDGDIASAEGLGNYNMGVELL